MQNILGEEWTITPAGGSTGEAYYAQSGRKRLFLKRNSSPFLAVLSAEGIVPKLVWTKRLENGDVITAQQWLEGRELSSEEMKHPRVAELLSKIHHSSELLDMFMRIGKKPIEPEAILADLKSQVAEINVDVTTLDFAFQYLSFNLTKVSKVEQVVCHCDMNHNNWMLSNDGKLFLIDWDNARVGDPALDIGMLLQSYIPTDEWDTWLESYGLMRNEQLVQRMYWYLIAETMSLYICSDVNCQKKEAAEHYSELKRLIHRVTVY
ncbi:phosphotransferase [Radiobacillus sp. PE A8.2]|uniref:phosphotransferase n=1 Tax=Radiobacillus sp. PE A8.2 TaxID=3380349 RepID=UPI00388F509A